MALFDTMWNPEALRKACEDIRQIDEDTLEFLEDTLVDVVRDYMEMEAAHVRFLEMAGDLEGAQSAVGEHLVSFAAYLTAIYGPKVGIALSIIVTNKMDDIFGVIKDSIAPSDGEEAMRMSRLRRVLLESNAVYFRYLKEMVYYAALKHRSEKEGRG